jgi:hypothetical protein
MWSITRTSIALANLRDGGILVIGVAEREGVWVLEGIADAHLATYDADLIREKVNAYVSPHVDLDIVNVAHGDKSFLAIQVREFRETPVLCKKNGPNGVGLTEGRLYVRPAGAARTTAVTSAGQMHDLLELAAEKRARRLLEASRRIGLVAPEPEDEAKYLKELEGL